MANGAVKCHTVWLWCTVCHYLQQYKVAWPLFCWVWVSTLGFLLFVAFLQTKKGTIYNQMPLLEDIPDKGVNTQQNIASQVIVTPTSNKLLKFLIFLSLFIPRSIPLSTTTSTTTTSPWKGEVPRVYDLSCDDTVCPPNSFCLTDYESGGSRCHCNLGRRGDTCSEGKKDFWILASFLKNILCQLCSDSVVAILSRLQEVALSSSNPWVLLLLICHDFSFHLSSFSVISEVSQIPWPLSHDLWTLKKLLSNLSDYFGV